MLRTVIYFPSRRNCRATTRANWWNMLQLVGEYGYSEEMITSIVKEYTLFANNP